MNKNSRYTVKDALEKIWELGSDLELDYLDDSDDDDDDDAVAPNPRIKDVDESDDDIDLETEKAGKVENPETEANEGYVEQEEEENAQTLIAKFEKYQQRGREKLPPGLPTTFLRKEFTHPEDEAKDWTPIKCFKLFWKDGLNGLISEQCYLYSVQHEDKSVAATSGKFSKSLDFRYL